jgi:hypothetical protein
LSGLEFLIKKEGGNFMVTVGLFGTCGESKWRDQFVQKYKELGISFFNPQTDDWKPKNAVEEARHLAEDEIILFPVTNETYASGSLAEVGLSILQAIKLDDRRDFIVLIDTDLADSLSDQIAREESLRARALVLEYLRKIRFSNIYLVDSLSQMLEVSIRLYEAAKIREPFKAYNPHNRPRN